MFMVTPVTCSSWQMRHVETVSQLFKVKVFEIILIDFDFFFGRDRMIDGKSKFSECPKL